MSNKFERIAKDTKELEEKENGIDVVKLKESKSDNSLLEKEEGLNKAIAYSLVMDMIKDKKDEKAMLTWDYLYQLSREECTHKEIDGSSSWVRPYENIGIDYKICNYCSWN